MTPFISIGVTTYKRPQYLKECLQYLLAQNFKDFEVLIGNNDVENPVSVSGLGIQDERVLVINHSKNLGQHGNMNALLQQAKGRYFTWIADDDLFLPGFLETASKTLQQSHAKVFFCAFHSGLTPPVMPTTSKTFEFSEFTGGEFLENYLYRKIETIGNYGVWEKNHLQSIGGMPVLGNGFSPFSDNLLAMRAGELERIAWTSEKLVFFRTHDQSLSWTSTNIDAYTSAQHDFSQEALRILETVPHFKFNALYFEFLKHWCLSYFYSVLERSPIPSFSYLLKYYGWLIGEAKALNWSSAIKLRFYSILWGIRLLRRKLRARNPKSGLVST